MLSNNNKGLVGKSELKSIVKVSFSIFPLFMKIFISLTILSVACIVSAVLNNYANLSIAGVVHDIFYYLNIRNIANELFQSIPTILQFWSTLPIIGGIVDSALSTAAATGTAYNALTEQSSLFAELFFGLSATVVFGIIFTAYKIATKMFDGEGGLHRATDIFCIIILCFPGTFVTVTLKDWLMGSYFKFGPTAAFIIMLIVVFLIALVRTRPTFKGRTAPEVLYAIAEVMMKIVCDLLRVAAAFLCVMCFVAAFYSDNMTVKALLTAVGAILVPVLLYLALKVIVDALDK